jgi:hypothetical protein
VGAPDPSGELRVLALNLELESENVLPVYKKPFDLIAVGVETGNWYA